MVDYKVPHLEMIQGVIDRMARNSFALKGWAVTLVAGIFALSSKNTDKMYFLVAYIPILVFWGLDAYYLLQEKLFRALFNKTRTTDETIIDFSMDVSLDEFRTPDNSYWKCIISPTELGFYFPLAIVTAGIIIITHI